MKRDPMSVRAPFWYTLVVGGFLFLQGISTLLFRLFPALDAAFPALLGTTHMIPIHSLLHIATGLIAFAVIRWGGARGTWWYALGFGAFYTLLALTGSLIGDVLGLGLQPFDHPFHLVAGIPGLISAALSYFTSPLKRELSR